MSDLAGERDLVDSVLVAERGPAAGLTVYRWVCRCGSVGLSKTNRDGDLRGYASHVEKSIKHSSAGAAPGVLDIGDEAQNRATRGR